MPLLLLSSLGQTGTSTAIVTVTDNALVIHQKSDFVYLFTVLNGVVPANIIGASFSGMFRWHFTDMSPVFDLGTEISIVTAASGLVKITIGNAATSAVVVPTTGIQSVMGGGLIDGGYTLYYDINMSLGGVVSRVLRGRATFYRSALQ